MSGVEDILAAMQQQHDNSDRTDAELDDIDDMDDIERVRAVFASIDRSVSGEQAAFTMADGSRGR